MAYFLEFETTRVNIIRQEGFENPEKCCRGVLIHWLDSKEGISPKTWKVLLKTLRDITDLTAVTEQIEEDIKKVAS